MIDKIKEKIAYVSRDLFNEYGYQKVTMRQIADACGISVGNLTYYYARKEDLLMLEHDWIMNTFLEEVFNGQYELEGMRGYVTVETAFMHTILRNYSVSRLYAQVINVPSLRARYCRTHHGIYQHFLPNASDDGKEWAATVAVSALEFGLLDEKLLTDDFAAVFEKIFISRLVFEGKSKAAYCEDIRIGIEAGIQLSAKLNIWR